MKQYILSSAHYTALEQQRKAHQAELGRRGEKHKRELSASEAKGYARGIDHGWLDALQRLRQIVGSERAEILREWREAAVTRANRREAGIQGTRRKYGKHASS